MTTPEGTKQGIAIGWEDVRDLDTSTITRRTTHDTHSIVLSSHKIMFVPPSTTSNANRTTKPHG